MIASDLRNPWLTTVSGVRFHLMNPKPEEIRLTDIAHALGQLCRFTGHTKRPYTVAEHSVLVALILREQGYDADTQMAGLFHDAHEAYVGDLSTPMKWAMDTFEFVPQGHIGTVPFRCIEDRIVEAISDRFCLPHVEQGIIKQADMIAGVTEARDLLNGAVIYPDPPAPYPHNVEIAMLWAQWLYTHSLDEILSPCDLFINVYSSLLGTP